MIQEIVINGTVNVSKDLILLTMRTKVGQPYIQSQLDQDKKAIETAHAIKDYVDEFCNQELVDQVSFGSTSRQAKLRYHQ